jgi:hypothetical protein
MQNIDASGIPVEWSVSWGVASKAAIPLSCPSRTFLRLDPNRERLLRSQPTLCDPLPIHERRDIRDAESQGYAAKADGRNRVAQR